MNADTDPTQTLDPHPPTAPFEVALDAGLAAAFGDDLTPGGWSRPPLLRDDPSDHSRLVQPSSPEMPREGGEPYQLLGEIARGGMGVILKGRDPDLGRDLAVKVLRAELAGRPAAVQRFVEEAQVGGQLQHPGVVPVYDLGRFADGRPYFAMKLVKGRTLADLLAERGNPSPTPPPAGEGLSPPSFPGKGDGGLGSSRGKFLQVFLQVCQTVAYAHSRGVIHRDLKPANVMVGGFGEVLVMDWGLAKVLPRGGVYDEMKAGRSHERPGAPADDPTEIRTARSGSGSETAAGSVLGTPAFMPPEQAGGEVEKLDERADVFGLGAILCVVLTGKPPYVAETGDAVRLMAVRGELADAFARLDACGTDDELVGLCKRCLAARRDARPRNAGELSAAVSGYLTNVEDRAHRAELDRAAAEAEAKEQRKRRRVQAALGMTFTALVVLGGAFAWWADRQAAERERSEVNRRVAAERGVNQAVEDAVARFGRATGAGRDPGLWAEARAAALQAAARASEAGAPPEVLDRIDRLVAGIDQVEKNQRLAAALLEIQAGMGDDLLPNGDQNFPGADERYARAFREYGTDLLAVPPEVGADLLRGLGSDIRVELAAAIDDWGYVRYVLAKSNGSTDADRLFRVTRLLDPDPTRNRIRDVVAAGDYAALNRLSGQIDPAAQPVQTVNLVAVYLYWLQPGVGPRNASRFLRKAHTHHPGGFQINHNLAFFLNRERQYAESLGYASAAVAVRPRSPAAWQDYAAALAGLGRRAEAAAAYRRLCELAPASVSARTRLVDLLTQLGDKKGAAVARADLLRVLRDSLGRGQASAAAYRDLAGRLRGLGDMEGAIEAYRAAARLAPNDYRAHDDLARALLSRGDFAAAVTAYRAAVGCAPQNSFLRYELGYAQARQGDLEGALATWAETVAVDPDCAAAYNGLAWVLAAGPDGVRDGRRAVEYATRACGLSGGANPYHIDILAAAYAECGDFDRAIEIENRALSYPAFAKPHGALARAKLELFRQRQPYRDADIARRAVAPPPREVKR